MNHSSQTKRFSPHQTAVLLILATSVLWSTSGVFIKLIDWSPLAISGVRSTIGALVILAYLRRPKFTWSRWQIGGALCYAFNMFAFVAATKLTTAANAIFLQYAAPVFVAIFGAWFLKERCRRSDWIAVIFVFLGLGLCFLDKLSATGLLGNLIGLTAGLSFAWLILFLRKQKDGSPLETVLLGNIIVALAAIPFYFSAPPPDSPGWCFLVLLGLLQLGIPYVLYSIAIKHIRAVEASVLQTVEPLLNPVWVAIFVGELPGMFALVGGVIVIGAITFQGVLSSTRTTS